MTVAELAATAAGALGGPHAAVWLRAVGAHGGRIPGGGDKKRPGVLLRIVQLPQGHMSAGPTVVRKGTKLTLELVNGSPVPAHVAIVQIDPKGKAEVVLPGDDKPIALAPWERRRLPVVFAAAPPVGSYTLRAVATASPMAWWKPGQGGALGKTLRQGLLRSPPTHLPPPTQWATSAGVLRILP